MPIIELKYLFKIFSGHYWSCFIFSLSIFYSSIFTFFFFFFFLQKMDFKKQDSSVKIHIQSLVMVKAAQISLWKLNSFLCRRAAQAQHAYWCTAKSPMAVPYLVSNITKDERSSPPIHLICHKWPWFVQN